MWIVLTFFSGVGLWLWLGVLDAIQGAGLGMILLQTLSRLHVCATLALAQFIGSVTVMVARATSPTKVGPGNAFPNPGIWGALLGVLISASPAPLLSLLLLIVRILQGSLVAHASLCYWSRCS